MTIYFKLLLFKQLQNNNTTDKKCFGKIIVNKNLIIEGIIHLGRLVIPED